MFDLSRKKLFFYGHRPCFCYRSYIPCHFEEFRYFFLSFLMAINVLSLCPWYSVGDFFRLTSSFLLFYTWHPLIVRVFINNLVFNEKVSLSSATSRRPFTEHFINRTRYVAYTLIISGAFFSRFGRGLPRLVLQKKIA